MTTVKARDKLSLAGTCKVDSMTKKANRTTRNMPADPYADMVLGERPDTLDIIKRAMIEAAREAVAENDRLGIPTPYGRNGKVSWRQPPRKQ